MRVINVTSGLFTIGRGERDGFRRHLAQHGIPCDVFGLTGAGWPEGNPGEVAHPEEAQLKLVHPEDIEKAKDLYETWSANQSPTRCE